MAASPLLQNSLLVKQGAEAKVYKSSFYPTPTLFAPTSLSSARLPKASTSALPQSVPLLLKHRFQKRYRHPTLDAQLTKQRLSSEARCLIRCAKFGVKAPALRFVDLKEGILAMEWIEGGSVRECLGGGADDDAGAYDEEEEDAAEAEAEDVREFMQRMGVEQDVLLATVGYEIGKMHLADIIHGDLTTSNMMVRLQDQSLGSSEGPETLITRPQPTNADVTTSTEFVPPSIFEVVMIDFGLSSVSSTPEDRAVDLYVLERAFASTHPVPVLADGSEGVPLFETVLAGYARCLEELGKKGTWTSVDRRLEDVRGRGRKRSMLG